MVVLFIFQLDKLSIYNNELQPSNKLNIVSKYFVFIFPKLCTEDKDLQSLNIQFEKKI